MEEDEIFSLAEQRNSTVETDSRDRRVEVRAGHVEIVGDKRAAATKLIAILQEEDAIPPTEPQRLSAFNQLLERIYRGDAYLTRDGLGSALCRPCRFPAERRLP